MARLVFVALCLSIGAWGNEADRTFLLDGVEEIPAPGIPGPLSVFGEEAFPVVVAKIGRNVVAPVVAATRMEAGRVVAFGHTGYLSPETGRLLLNAVRWVSGEVSSPRVAVHGSAELIEFLREAGFQAEAWDPSRPLDGDDALCIGSHALEDEKTIATIAEFVRAGGGLVTAGLGWGWQQLNPNRELAEDHPGNRLLAPAGIVWGDGYLRRTSPNGFRVDLGPLEWTHARRALAALRSPEDLPAGVLEQAAWTVSHALRSLPSTDTLFLPEVVRLAREAENVALPRPDRPLGLDQGLARVLLTYELLTLRRTPSDAMTAHPAAASFPGSVPPDAERVERRVIVDPSVPDWQSTGLYAPPGEQIVVRLPEAARNLGLQLQIGAHTDRLWEKTSWRRAPEIVTRVPLDDAETVAANPFGGLIYVVVPRGLDAGTIPVTIAGAVDAPYYVFGKTDLERWRSTIRLHPAPWGELASDRLILTVPSEALRALERPDELMAFWNRVLDANAELAAIPRKRPRPERIVADAQISAGYMHAGYPIMTHLDAVDLSLDVDRLMERGSWGHFHEIGHNHQSPDWTFAGTGEVTVNLFTLYVYDTVCGIPPSKSRDNLAPERIRAAVAKHLAEGAPFKRWKSDPFLALMMYVQMQEAFGWEPFRKVFAEYRDLPSEARPKSDDEKRDQWLVRFSRTVGRNLGPFFEAWGVPTSPEARRSIDDLPVWFPEDFPSTDRD